MKRLFLTSLLALGALSMMAQDLKSGPYDLPYKNTYVKNIFVAENSFRTMKPETKAPKTFKEAQKILPSPVWEGHEKEIEMYWHAWKIAVGNIRSNLLIDEKNLFYHIALFIRMQRYEK